MRIIIVEDEQLAANRLFKIISEQVPEVELLAQPDSVEEAIQAFSEHQPDLAFFDIQLADGISFEIFENAKVECPVVFTTAYDDYALKAFKVNSIDYLLKPINVEELKAALNKFHNSRLNSPEVFQQMLSQLGHRPQFKKRFFVKSGTQLSFVPVDDLAFFISSSSSTFLVTKENNQFIIDQTLDELEQVLDPKIFHRINRGCIVALSSIQKMEAYLSNRLLLHVIPEYGEEQMIVSRQRVKAFKEWIDQ
ncbi:MAG: response regulator transcription factor [Flavobacteriales bacterium]|nr:response regulator transcription factor [Flavobacteriales bacterium]